MASKKKQPKYPEFLYVAHKNEYYWAAEEQNKVSEEELDKDNSVAVYQLVSVKTMKITKELV